MAQEKKTKILVADDNQQHAELLKFHLTDAGHEVITAGDGEEALRCAKQGAIDLILLDVMMSGLNGYEVCERIKKDEREKSSIYNTLGELR